MCFKAAAAAAVPIRPPLDGHFSIPCPWCCLPSVRPNSRPGSLNPNLQNPEPSTLELICFGPKSDHKLSVARRPGRYEAGCRDRGIDVMTRVCEMLNKREGNLSKLRLGRDGGASIAPALACNTVMHGLSLHKNELQGCFPARLFGFIRAAVEGRDVRTLRGAGWRDPDPTSIFFRV